MRVIGHAAVVAERVTFSLKEALGARAPRRLDRLSEMAVYVAALAARTLPAVAPERAAVFFATDFGNFSGTTAFLSRLHEKGARLANPLEFPNLVLSAPTGTLSLVFGFKGELLAFNAGALHAVWAAQECLASDRADVALIVGAEEHNLARPGAVLEGAGAIVLDKRAKSGPKLSFCWDDLASDLAVTVTPAVNPIIDLAQACAHGRATRVEDRGMAVLIEA